MAGKRECRLPTGRQGSVFLVFPVQSYKLCKVALKTVPVLLHLKFIFQIPSAATKEVAVFKDFTLKIDRRKYLINNGLALEAGCLKCLRQRLRKPLSLGRRRLSSETHPTSLRSWDCIKRCVSDAISEDWALEIHISSTFQRRLRKSASSRNSRLQGSKRFIRFDPGESQTFL